MPGRERRRRSRPSMKARTARPARRSCWRAKSRSQTRCSSAVKACQFCGIVKSSAAPGARAGEGGGLEDVKAVHNEKPRPESRTGSQKTRLLKARQFGPARGLARSEEHKYELQSLMRISYADFC